MKKYLFMAMAAFMLVLASCGGSKFNDKKAGELIDKYKDYESIQNMSQDEANEVADLVIAYYNDLAKAAEKSAGETDAKKLKEANDNFEKDHKNADKLLGIYNSLPDSKLTTEKKNAVTDAKDKCTKAAEKAADKTKAALNN